MTVLQDKGFKVNYGHIETGQNFFGYQEPQGDIVVSNPPFSKRDAIFERLYEWDVPFALIINFNGLFDSKKRVDIFRKHRVEMLIPRGRMKFYHKDKGVFRMTAEIKPNEGIHYYDGRTIKLKELLPLIRSSGYSNQDELGTHVMLCLECEEWTWVDFNSSSGLLDILGELGVDSIDPSDEKTIKLWIKTDDFNWFDLDRMEELKNDK